MSHEYIQLFNLFTFAPVFDLPPHCSCFISGIAGRFAISSRRRLPAPTAELSLKRSVRSLCAACCRLARHVALQMAKLSPCRNCSFVGTGSTLSRKNDCYNFWWIDLLHDVFWCFMNLHIWMRPLSVNLRATPRLSRSRFRKPSMSSCTSFRAEREGLFFVHVYAPGIPKRCMSVYHCISAIPATTIYNALHLPELSLNRIPGRIGNPFFCVAARPHLPRFGYTKGPCHRICVNFHFRGRCGTWPKTNGNGISKILPQFATHIYPIYPLPL